MDCNERIYNRHTKQHEPNPDFAGTEKCEGQAFKTRLDLFGKPMTVEEWPSELRGLFLDVEAAENRLAAGISQWLAARGITGE